MNIVLCVKQIPDTQQVRIDPKTNTLIRRGVPGILNPFDESSLELGLEIQQRLGARLTVLTMGIPDSECILREALSFGVDRAFLLTHSSFAGADSLATSYTLSRAIETIGKFDLLLFGKQTMDGDTAQVGPEVAAHLGIPVITFVMNLIEVGEDHIVVERMIDNGKQIVQSGYPVALTVVRTKSRLRMPTVDGLLRSFRVPVKRLGPKEIGAEKELCGLEGSPTRVKRIFSPKTHARGTFLEGTIEEKAKRFVQIVKEKRIDMQGND